MVDRLSPVHRLARPRRFVLVSNAYQFVYYPVPKVATRSLLAALRSADPESIEFTKLPWRPGRFRTFRSLACVRDPFDRLHSCWVNKVRDTNQFYPDLAGADFARFVEVLADWDLQNVTADQAVTQ